MSCYQILCYRCVGNGFCKNTKSLIVSDAELDNPEFIRDVRKTAYSLQTTNTQWLHLITNLYRDYLGIIVDGAWQEQFLDMEVFEIAYIEDWFKVWCNTKCPAHVKPSIHPRARERVRALATILRASFPKAAQNWGYGEANDNFPIK